MLIKKDDYICEIPCNMVIYYDMVMMLKNRNENTINLPENISKEDLIAFDTYILKTTPFNYQKLREYEIIYGIIKVNTYCLFNEDYSCFDDTYYPKIDKKILDLFYKLEGVKSGKILSYPGDHPYLNNLIINHVQKNNLEYDIGFISKFLRRPNEFEKLIPNISDIYTYQLMIEKNKLEYDPKISKYFYDKGSWNPRSLKAIYDDDKNYFDTCNIPEVIIELLKFSKTYVVLKNCDFAEVYKILASYKNKKDVLKIYKNVHKLKNGNDVAYNLILHEYLYLYNNNYTMIQPKKSLFLKYSKLKEREKKLINMRLASDSFSKGYLINYNGKKFKVESGGSAIVLKDENDNVLEKTNKYEIKLPINYWFS